MENKLTFKKVFVIAFTLMLVSALSGALIVCLNMVTEPIIAENEVNKENKLLEEVYPGATFKKIDYSNDTILSISQAFKDDKYLGRVYKVTGKNAYGSITLLVGINLDGTLENVVFMENGESFASTVYDHTDASYTKGMEANDVENVDVKCGATYGAKLVKELIQAALDDASRRN